MKNKIGLLVNGKWAAWTPSVLSVLGVLAYLLQAVNYAHSTIPGLDEGSYLLKGILYLRGVYEPFEPYGPLTNKAPFAFLIPGFAQTLFGAGLRTGRYFAIALGLLTLLGIWISARRWAGKWAAAGVIWIYALSPMIIKIQAITASEVIISCLLAWVCVLVIAEERSLWQVILGSLIATLSVLTRQNMVLVLPLLVLYVFWQHGRAKGLWSLAASAALFLAVHLYYWPNILIIWAPWLPEDLTPFLNMFRMPKESVPNWNPSLDFWNRLSAFFQGVRYHFIPVVGSIFAVLLWPKRAEWRSASAMRASIFLACSYFILFAMHAWAAVASQYESYSCVYCFTPYLTFFDPLGILFFVIVFSSMWNAPRFSAVMNILLAAIVLILSTGMGYSLFENIGQNILNFQVPRMRDGGFLPGTAALVDVITGKFGLSMSMVKRSISASFGLIAGFVSLLIALIVLRRSRKTGSQPGFGMVLVNSYLILGVILFPVLNAGGSRPDCEMDVIASNEQLGAHLDSVIPADSLVYWDGGLSFTPMVYVPDVRIFPPQINNGYTYWHGGDTDTIFRLNHWNAELKEQWIDNADVFIIESRRYASWKDFFSPQEFEEYEKPLAEPSCEAGSGLRIFHRLP
ncbi:MAG: glycosyltransferase family 39 protein [Anaerolineales bacterium]|nr:glycosyltransferase family 39 protein [Anaerolineales bacterium]